MTSHHPTKLWSAAHTINGLQKSSTRSELLEVEAEWLNATAHAPQGNLLHHNAFLSQLQQDDVVHLMHVTTSLEAITASSVMSPSGGCLVGSVYCTPLATTAGGLRAHNLGAYILEQEVPRSLCSKGLENRPIDALVIEIQPPHQITSRLVGIDYLRLGAVHLEAFRKLQSLMDESDFAPLEERVIRQIAGAEHFLGVCAGSIFDRESVSLERFFLLLTGAIRHLPILGYLYFEVVIEYIMLFSDDAKSSTLAAQGELNSWGSKEFIFQVQPSLFKNFNLGDFRPSLAKLVRTADRLAAASIIHIDPADFAAYIQRRLSQLVCARLIPEYRAANQLRGTFDTLALRFPHLTGHALDREIRRPRVYQNLHFHFDREKAHQVWQHWNDYNAVLPYNAILPKGEVGLNPARADIPYKVYRGRPYYVDDALYIQKQEVLDIRITADFLHPKHALMGITNNS